MKELVRQLIEYAASCGLRLRCIDAELADDATSTTVVLRDDAGERISPVNAMAWAPVVEDATARGLTVSIDADQHGMLIALAAPKNATRRRHAEASE